MCIQNDPNFKMKIVLKHDQPINYKVQHISYCDLEKFKIILKDLLREDMIRARKSPYSIPVIPVCKKTSDLRLCIDYCELNKITVKKFPCTIYR